MSSTPIRHFRTAYVPQNSGHDLTALKDLCDKIVFCSTGYEAEAELPQAIEQAMKEFDPRKDIIVPVGNVTSNFLVGMVAQKMMLPYEAYLENVPCVSMAIYRDKAYTVRDVLLGADNGSQD